MSCLVTKKLTLEELIDGSSLDKSTQGADSTQVDLIASNSNRIRSDSVIARELQAQFNADSMNSSLGNILPAPPSANRSRSDSDVARELQAQVSLNYSFPLKFVITLFCMII